MILFVGERRSPTAIRKGWTWHSGRLAAKTLFGAIEHAGIDRSCCDFTNLFEVQRFQGWPRVFEAIERGSMIVAMGRRVQEILKLYGVPHVPIVHPAARGAVRLTERYRIHVAIELQGVPR